MATAAIGVLNANTVGLTVSDVIVFAIGGTSAYAITDYMFPNAGFVESSITSVMSDVPILGDLWGVGEGLDSLLKSLYNLSFLVGVVAGMAGQMVTKDGSFGLLCALGAGSLEAFYMNGTFSKLNPVL